jgi:nitroreductase
MDSGGSSAGLLQAPVPAGVLEGPLQGGPRQDVPIGPDAGIMAILSTTRAMRHLAPDPVPDALVRTLIEAATWAPSAGNAQPAAFVVVTDRRTMTRLAVVWRQVIDDYRLLMESAGIRGGTDPASERIRAAVEYQRDHFAETPALIIVCEDRRVLGPGVRSSASAFRFLVRRVGLRRALGLLRAWMHAAPRAEGGSYYPAVQNLLLAARAHGLAACMTSWHLFAEDEFKRVVGIPTDVKTFAVIPIGWPLRRFGPVRRRPVDEVIHLERW